MIYRTWLQYLESKHAKFGANSQAPSPIWSESAQQEWPIYDLAISFVPDSATSKVLLIEPTGAGSPDFRIVTHFSKRGDAGPAACADTTLDITTFATRIDDGWRLSGALPRLTRDWRREVVGPITFFVDPRLSFNVDRAKASAAFVDSVATLLGFGKVSPLSYYVASSFDQVCEILGVQRSLRFGPRGGITVTQNRQVFSGNPAIGEGYHHELAHLIVQPLMSGMSTMIAVEGVATWLGGTDGRDYKSLERLLASHLARHPAVTLDSIMNAEQPGGLEGGASVEYVAGAALSELVFERAGPAGLRTLLRATTLAELRASLEREFREPWASIASQWRTRVMSSESKP